MKKLIYETLKKKNGINIEEIIDVAISCEVAGMDETHTLLWETDRDKTVKIVGDYDVDGIMSTYIMTEILQGMGFTDVSHRTPLRTEGYGMSMVIVDEIPNNSLVITVDNGIACHEQVDALKEKGCTVIIIDHHLPVPNKKLPNADAIIDPHVFGGDFKEFCGAGLCYKLARQIFEGSDEFLAKLSTSAMVATIADVVSLTGENRAIVKEGLANLPYAPKGLKELFVCSNLVCHVTAENVAFKIAPALNACGRVDNDAEKAVKLMLSTSAEEIVALVDDILKTNEVRKEMTTEATDLSEEFVMKNELAEQPVIVLTSTIPEGVIGIIAGRLKDRFNRSAIVLTDLGDGTFKGSGRAVKEHHLKQLLDSCGDLLLSYGGHAGACGLKIHSDNLKEFYQRINQNAVMPSDDLQDKADLEISEEDIPLVADILESLEPFGQGFENLNIKVDIIPRSRETIGKTVVGTKMPLSAPYTNALAFVDVPSEGGFSCIGKVGKNYFIGRNGTEYVSNQLMISEVL